MTTLNSVRKLKIALLSGAVAMGWSAPALAQDGAEASDQDDGNVIVVTATKRAESVQDVPIAIAVVDGEQLARTGAADLSDVIGRAPNLSFARGNRSTNQIAIRGLSSLVANVSDFPVVSAYIDEVPISEATVPDVGLIDLARVEVLRGPQGTLYGEGAMGGTIRFVTNKPDLDDFSVSGQAEVGTIRYGGESYRVNGVVNIPLVEGVAALRLAGLFEDFGGFVDNASSGEQNADAFDRVGGRATLLIEPDSNLSISLSGTYQKFEGGMSPNVFTGIIPGVTPTLLTANQLGDFTGFQQGDVGSEDELYILNATINYDFGFATLTSSTSYYDRQREFLNDETFTGRSIEAGLTPLTTNPGLAPLFAQAGLGGPFVIRNGTLVNGVRDNEIFAQELRLSSNGDNTVDWTVGGYYRERDANDVVDTTAPDIIPVNQVLLAVPPAFGGPLSGNPNYNGEVQATTAQVEYRQIAVFGEVDVELSDTISFIGGLRYLSERIDADNSISFLNAAAPGPTFLTFPTLNFPSDPTTQDEVLYKVGFTLQASDDALIYTQVANGIRPGGINERASNVNESTFGGDSVTTFELGAKTAWLDGDLVLNGAVFYTQWSDIQFSDARNPQFPVIRNAGEAEVFGIELDMVAYPTPSLTLTAAFAFNDAQFSEDSLQIPGSGLFIIEDGQRLPITPGFAAGFFIDYEEPISSDLELIGNVGFTYVGEREANTVRAATSPAPGLFGTLDDYVEVNAQIGVAAENYTVSLFVNNLFDEFGQLGGAPARGFTVIDPRTIGVRVGLNF